MGRQGELDKVEKQLLDQKCSVPEDPKLPCQEQCDKDSKTLQKMKDLFELKKSDVKKSCEAKGRRLQAPTPAPAPAPKPETKECTEAKKEVEVYTFIITQFEAKVKACKCEKPEPGPKPPVVIKTCQELLDSRELKRERIHYLTIAKEQGCNKKRSLLPHLLPHLLRNLLNHNP